MSDAFASMPEHYSFIKLAEDSHKISWSEGHRHPVLLIRISSQHRAYLNILMEKNWIIEASIDGTDVGTNTESIDKLLGKSGRLTFQLPVPTEDVAIVKDIDNLLEYSKFLINAPRLTYLVDQKTHILPQGYLDAVSLANTLKRTADHFEDRDDEYICYFYNGGRVVVPIKYFSSETRPLPGIHEMQLFFSEGPNLNEKIKIFKSSIIKLSMTCPSESMAFTHLIENFQSLKNTFEQDWNFYLSEFSFNDILDEIEEKILKIADKISSSLYDLQRTMITIPLAIIFAAPRIDTSDIKSIKNIIIIASVWIFALFTWAFFYNHKLNLSFIVKEIEDQKRVASEKHKGLAEKINKKLDVLADRCSSQALYRKIVGGIMLFAVLAITVLYFGWLINLPGAPVGRTTCP